MTQRLIKAGTVDLPPRYTPWIGRTLASRLAKLNTGDPVRFGEDDRLLVLGESHYARPGDPDSYVDHPDLTREVVRDWALSEDRRSAFFSRVATLSRAGLHREPSSDDAWDDFAFAEYVQSLVVTGPRTAPTWDQWRDAERRFFRLLVLTRPAVTVVLGSRLWENLPSNVGVRTPPMQLFKDTPVKDVWFYPFEDGDQWECTFAVKVVHPSAGFGNWNTELAARIVRTVRYYYSNLVCYMVDRMKESGSPPFQGMEPDCDKDDLASFTQHLDWPFP